MGCKVQFLDGHYLIERKSKRGHHTFEWDENNRLASATNRESGTQTIMTYDAQGRRLSKATGDQTTTFLWDGDQLLSDNVGGENNREFVYYPGSFEPLAIIDENKTINLIHTDSVGLPQEVTNESGDLVWSASYDSQGSVETLHTEILDNPIRFQGQYYDPETGLNYNRHRYFDSNTTTFISADPLGLAAGENIYSYAPSVWGWIDPLGLCKDHPGADKGHILSGHGAHNPWDGYTQVPEGTSVTTWTEHGNTISDRLGNYIETRKNIDYEYGYQIEGARTFLPGSKIPNYTLYPPDNLKIKGNPTTVTAPKTLNKLLKPNMGNVQWAACQSKLNRFTGVLDKIFNFFNL